MIITEAQLYQVAQIIRDHHSAFIATAISPDLIEKQVLEKLKAKALCIICSVFLSPANITFKSSGWLK